MKAVFKTTAPGGNDTVRDLTVRFAAGETIFSEGDLGTEMFIIHDGEVHIVKRFGSDAHVLSRLERGDFFGEMAVVEGASRSADAIAHTDVKLLAINGSRFDEMLRKTPEIAVRMIRKYSKRLREANALIEKLAGQPLHPEHASSDSTPAVSERQRLHRLVDLATGNAFFLGGGDETTIGRADPVTGILPDIDLTGVDVNRSVSRRHAKLLKRADAYFAFEEVGTVNGTFVNDQRVPTGVPVPVANGDRLRIGLIEMKVVFE